MLVGKMIMKSSKLTKTNQNTHHTYTHTPHLSNAFFQESLPQKWPIQNLVTWLSSTDGLWFLVLELTVAFLWSSQGGCLVLGSDWMPWCPVAGCPPDPCYLTPHSSAPAVFSFLRGVWIWRVIISSGKPSTWMVPASILLEQSSYVSCAEGQWRRKLCWCGY